MAKKAVMIRLEPDLIEAIAERANEREMSISTWVAKACEASLAQKGITIRYVTEVRI